MPNTGLLATLDNMSFHSEATLIGDTAIESELFLAALAEECATPEEYARLIDEAAIEMALYGLIDNAEAAMEASKNIIRMTKGAKFNSVERRGCIRLARKAEDPLYDKYAKARKIMIETRKAIYRKYENKSKTETKKILLNNRRKATAMTSDAGKSIVDKMDRQIQKSAARSK